MMMMMMTMMMMMVVVVVVVVFVGTTKDDSNEEACCCAHSSCFLLLLVLLLESPLAYNCCDGFIASISISLNELIGAKKSELWLLAMYRSSSAVLQGNITPLNPNRRLTFGKNHGKSTSSWGSLGAPLRAAGEVVGRLAT